MKCHAVVFSSTFNMQRDTEKVDDRSDCDRTIKPRTSMRKKQTFHERAGRLRLMKLKSNESVRVIKISELSVAIIVKLAQLSFCTIEFDCKQAFVAIYCISLIYCLLSDFCVLRLNCLFSDNQVTLMITAFRGPMRW